MELTLTGGRRDGKRLDSAKRLIDYIDSLEPYKMYGIAKFGSGTTILTTQEVVQKKDYEKLEEENKQFREFYMACGKEDIVKDITATRFMQIIEEGYIHGLQVAEEKYKRLVKDMIPTSLVIEKIEELEKEYKIALEENSTKGFILKCKIQGLQDLLGEE